MTQLLRRTVATLALLLVAPVLVACEEDPPTVTLLLADAHSGPWQSVGVPTFRERVRERCTECRVVLRSAGGDAATQQRQYDAALESETDVVVLDAADPEAAERLVGRAGEVPVVTWDAFVPGADHHVGSDPARVGRLLGEHVTAASGQGEGKNPGPRVLALRAPAGDPTAAAAQLAALSELDSDGVDVTEVDGPDPAAAREAVSTRTGQAAYDVVLAATDEQAAASAEALSGRADAPTVVGPRAGLETARRIVSGQQEMAVYEPHHRMATRAADVSLTLLAGEEPRGGKAHEGVNSWLFRSRPVTLDSLTTVMVRDGAIDLTQLCRGDTQDRCTAVGLV